MCIIYMVNERELSHVNFINNGFAVSDSIFSSLGTHSGDTNLVNKTQTLNKINVNKMYEKIDSTNKKFFSSLKEYVDSYVNYLLNPTSNTYWNTYQMHDSIVKNNKNELTQISYSIQGETANMSSQTASKKSMISNEQTYHNTLLGKEDDINKSDNSSSQLIDESVEMYKSQYIDNCILIFGIIILLIMTYKLYK